MADIVTPEKRSEMMAAIRSKDTQPELRLRRMLHAMGFRYSLSVRCGGARPDMFFARYRAAVFVHGCFWHGHEGCSRHRVPKSNGEFWMAKFARNKARDSVDQINLAAAGYRVAVVWECVLSRGQAVETAAAVGRWLVSDERRLELPAGGDPGVASGVGACDPA